MRHQELQMSTEICSLSQSLMNVKGDMKDETDRVKLLSGQRIQVPQPRGLLLLRPYPFGSPGHL
jgi:hypothetical protein